MEIVTGKPEFRQQVSCSCGALFDVSLTDLKCAHLRAADMPDWFPVFVTCPECGVDKDLIVPRYLQRQLMEAALAKEQAGKRLSLLSRILRRIRGVV